MTTFDLHINDKDFVAADYLDGTAFDEKFEIDLDKDYIHNIYHVRNKYYVPVMSGSYSGMYQFAKDNLVHPEDKGYVEFMDPSTMKDRVNASLNGIIRAEFRQKMEDGSYRWVEYFGVSGKENGVPEDKIYFYIFDIQNRHDRIEGKPSVMFNSESRNPITGLRLGDSFIVHTLGLVNSKKGPWCCIAIDIQHFKIFNAWFGLSRGEYLLGLVGSYLKNIETTEDAVAVYFGRDHFALFTRFDKARIQEMYDEIRSIVGSYGNMAGFLPAFGVCVLEDDTKPDLSTYDRAKIAAEEAKKTYANRVQYFDSKKYIRTRDNLELLMKFQDALKNDEIKFYIQPQCNLTTGKIMGCEALARWFAEDGSLLVPGFFIPMLEASGFITELDKKVWENVCKWLRSLMDRNIEPVPISVNVSQVDLLSMDIAAYMYALTERFNIPPKFLKIEITETAFADNFDSISKTIDDLKSRGFTVLLDDFGSGYSSLNMLDKINADVIKLEMDFMQKENSLSKKGISIVESIMSMARGLEVPVIVEGVATEEQVKFLNTLGCRYVQGFYFYKPMPVEDFEKLIENRENIELDNYKARITDLFHAKEFLNENMFTGSMLNHILGAVAYYSLDGKDLTITRFNEMFYKAIGDTKMDTRISSIQNYVVKADWPILYNALEVAEKDAVNGGSCEIRFYKSDNSVFWFHMQFFFLKEDNGKKMFYGQVEDITAFREQSLAFFDVLKSMSTMTLCMDLDRNIVYYVTERNSLIHQDAQSMNLDESIHRTVENRTTTEEDKQAFLKFFDKERLKDAYQKAIYHEDLTIMFRLKDEPVLTNFSTYYIRHSKNQGLQVYAFVKPVTESK
ncbi:MAG: GGDEF domain-containing phosphodiesterase [Clostridia bacterium]|nr:GGDEF domain-containing phosphodiesterase [Clostridia bacterium]